MKIYSVGNQKVFCPLKFLSDGGKMSFVLSPEVQKVSRGAPWDRLCLDNIKGDKGFALISF